VRLVIADTGLINYLILIGHIDILPRLFERVIVPGVVLAELSHELAPASVRRWVAAAPDWLEVEESPAVVLSSGIHKGEAAAIESMPTCCLWMTAGESLRRKDRA
jgi:predicted nucleic acid-binding protein